MTEIMEPGTADVNRRTIHLGNINRWSENIIDFQRQTERLSIENLLKVSPQPCTPAGKLY